MRKFLAIVAAFVVGLLGYSAYAQDYPGITFSQRGTDLIVTWVNGAEIEFQADAQNNVDGYRAYVTNGTDTDYLTRSYTNREGDVISTSTYSSNSFITFSVGGLNLPDGSYNLVIPADYVNVKNYGGSNVGLGLNVEMTFPFTIGAGSGTEPEPSYTFTATYTGSYYKVYVNGASSVTAGSTNPKGAYFENLADGTKYEDVTFSKDYSETAVIFLEPNLLVNGFMVNLDNMGLPTGEYKLVVPAGYFKFDNQSCEGFEVEGFSYTEVTDPLPAGILDVTAQVKAGNILWITWKAVDTEERILKTTVLDPNARVNVYHNDGGYGRLPFTKEDSSIKIDLNEDIQYGDITPGGTYKVVVPADILKFDLYSGPKYVNTETTVTFVNAQPAMDVQATWDPVKDTFVKGQPAIVTVTWEGATIAHIDNAPEIVARFSTFTSSEQTPLVFGTDVTIANNALQINLGNLPALEEGNLYLIDIPSAYVTLNIDGTVYVNTTTDSSYGLVAAQAEPNATFYFQDGEEDDFELGSDPYLFVTLWNNTADKSIDVNSNSMPLTVDGTTIVKIAPESFDYDVTVSVEGGIEDEDYYLDQDGREWFLTLFPRVTGLEVTVKVYLEGQAPGQTPSVTAVTSSFSIQSYDPWVNEIPASELVKAITMSYFDNTTFQPVDVDITSTNPVITTPVGTSISVKPTDGYIIQSITGGTTANATVSEPGENDTEWNIYIPFDAPEDRTSFWISVDYAPAIEEVKTTFSLQSANPWVDPGLSNEELMESVTITYGEETVAITSINPVATIPVGTTVTITPTSGYQVTDVSGGNTINPTISHEGDVWTIAIPETVEESETQFWVAIDYAEEQEPVNFEDFTAAPTEIDESGFWGMTFTWPNATTVTVVDESKVYVQDPNYQYLIGGDGLVVTAEGNRLIIDAANAPVINNSSWEAWTYAGVFNGGISVDGQILMVGEDPEDEFAGISKQLTWAPGAVMMPEPEFTPNKGYNAAPTISEITVNWPEYWVGYSDEADSWTAVSNLIKIYKEEMYSWNYTYSDPIAVTVTGGGDQFNGISTRWYENLVITPAETLDDPTIQYVLVIPSNTLGFKNIDTEDNVDTYAELVEAIFSVTGDNSIAVSPRQGQYVNLETSGWNGFIIENAAKAGVTLIDASKVLLYDSYLASNAEVAAATPVATGFEASGNEGDIVIDFDYSWINGNYTIIVGDGAFSGLPTEKNSSNPLYMDLSNYYGVRFVIEGAAAAELPAPSVEPSTGEVATVDQVVVSWNGLTLIDPNAQPEIGLAYDRVEGAQPIRGTMTYKGETTGINWYISREPRDGGNDDGDTTEFDYALVYTPETPITNAGDYTFTVPKGSVIIYVNQMNQLPNEEVNVYLTVEGDENPGEETVNAQLVFAEDLYTIDLNDNDTETKAELPVEINLEGDNFEYSGFQFDLVIDEELTLEGVTTSLETGEKAEVDYNFIESEGVYRVLWQNAGTKYDAPTENIVTLNLSARYQEGMQTTMAGILINNPVYFSPVTGIEDIIVQGSSVDVKINVVHVPVLNSIEVTDAVLDMPSYDLYFDWEKASVTVGEDLDLTVVLKNDNDEVTPNENYLVVTTDVEGVTVDANLNDEGQVETYTVITGGAQIEDTTTVTVTFTAGNVKGSYSFDIRKQIEGDANDNGAVTVSDVVTTANYILALPTVDEEGEANLFGSLVLRFDYPNANVVAGAEDEITVEDVNGITNLVLGKPVSGMKRRAAVMPTNDALIVDDFTVALNKAFEIGVGLDNTYEYSALQAVVVIPEGMTVAGVTKGARAAAHDIAYNVMPNGNVAIVIYSTSNAPFAAGNGKLFNLIVTANENAGNVTVEAIRAADADTNGYDLTVAGGRNESLVTGIYDLSADEAADARYFTVDGIEVRNPQAGQIVIRVEGNKVEKVVVK